MLSLWVLALQHCLWLSSLTRAQDTQYFIQPPDRGDNSLYSSDNIYTVGDVLVVQWVTTQDLYSIWLWQQNMNEEAAVSGPAIFSEFSLIAVCPCKPPASNTATASQSGTSSSSYNWTIALQPFDLSLSPVFFLQLGPTGDASASDSTTCHYFNLTMPDTSTTSTSSSSTSSSYVSTATVTATPTSSSSAAAQTQNGKSDNNQSTNTLGLGLGLGLGIPLLLALLGGAIYLLRRRKKQEAAGHVYPANPPVSERPPVHYHDVDRNSAYSSAKPGNGAPPQYYHANPVELSTSNLSH